MHNNMLSAGFYFFVCLPKTAIVTFLALDFFFHFSKRARFVRLIYRHILCLFSLRAQWTQTHFSFRPLNQLVFVCNSPMSLLSNSRRSSPRTSLYAHLTILIHTAKKPTMFVAFFVGSLPPRLRLNARHFQCDILICGCCACNSYKRVYNFFGCCCLFRRLIPYYKAS